MIGTEVIRELKDLPNDRLLERYVRMLQEKEVLATARDAQYAESTLGSIVEALRTELMSRLEEREILIKDLANLREQIVRILAKTTLAICSSLST